MSVRTRSAKRIAAKNKALAGTPAVLATSVHEKDNMRVGITVAPRKFVATARVSIQAPFTAPRLDMGEYQQVSTHAQQIDKISGTDYDYSVA